MNAVRSATVTKLRRKAERFPFTDDRLGEKKLPRRAVRFEVYDEVYSGLELRVTPQGTRTFRYRKSGHPTLTLGTFGVGSKDDMTVEEARREVDGIIRARKDGREPADDRKKARADEERSTRSPKAMLEEFLEVRLWRGEPLAEATRIAYLGDMEFVLAEYYGLPITRLSPETFSKLHREASKKKMRPDKRGKMRLIGSPSRADRAAHVLSTLCKKAKIENVARLIYEEGRIKKLRAADCRLDVDDVPKVVPWLEEYAATHSETADGLLAEMQLLALSTGLRRRALSGLEFAMVKPAKRSPGRYWLDIPGRLMKNKRPAQLPLAPKAAALLLARRERIPGVFVFPKARSDEPLIDTTALDEAIRERWTDEGVGEDGLFGLHDMRKLNTYALEYHAKASAAIQDILLGNTPKGTREENYLNVHAKIEDLMAYADAAEAYLRPGRAKPARAKTRAA